MGYIGKCAAALAAGALLAGSPAAAQGKMGTAEKLRRLDIMLMVTSLRCRFGPDDFQADYAAFSARHLNTLNTAARSLDKELRAGLGPKAAKRALDKMSVGIANSYGMGHPTLGCAELKQVAQGLVRANGEGALVAAADVLLGGDANESILIARR